MHYILTFLLLPLSLSLAFCQSPKASKKKAQATETETAAESAAPPAAPLPGTQAQPAPAPVEWTDMATFAPEIKQDIKYATTDNFTKKQIYDCPRCLLRPEVAEAVLSAHKSLKKQGYGLLMKDCYRPGPYQQRLWDAVPNEDYVAHPSKGSMHSRGVAVDLTLVDSLGNELDMGTPYDFFGPEAHTAYTNLPEAILNRRRILKKALEDQGFNAIKYEWWHYNYRQKEYPLSNYVWPCR